MKCVDESEGRKGAKITHNRRKSDAHSDVHRALRYLLPKTITKTALTNRRSTATISIKLKTITAQTKRQLMNTI